MLPVLAFVMFTESLSERRPARPRRPSFVGREIEADDAGSRSVAKSRASSTHQSLFLQVPLDQSSGMGDVPSSNQFDSLRQEGLGTTLSPGVTLVQRRDLDVHGAGFMSGSGRRVLWTALTVSGGIGVGAIGGLIGGLFVFF
ncbi:MAG: hypothetical protein CL790_06920 [Chloroflexi bacterium]|nr:hypothetical protein [Chloroflexota bacterium]